MFTILGKIDNICITYNKNLYMKHLNYHHLYYFYLVAKEGSVSKAGLKLRLSQPTISAQIKLFEETIGYSLFKKSGRGLTLNNIGEKVFLKAEKIFSTGRELLSEVENLTTHPNHRLSLGVPDSMSKLLVANFLSSFLKQSSQNTIYYREGMMDVLLNLLLEGKIDAILTDSLPQNNVKIKIYKHFLGKSEIALYGSISKKLKSNEPLRIILPVETSGIRDGISKWLDENKQRLFCVAELEEIALAKKLAMMGHGAMFEVTAVSEEMLKYYKLKILEVLDVFQSYYVITLDKKVRNEHLQNFIKMANLHFTQGLA